MNKDYLIAKLKEILAVSKACDSQEASADLYKIEALLGELIKGLE